MNVIIAFVLGGVIGILACYAWQKGFVQEVGVK